jgi:hypothetical protein
MTAQDITTSVTEADLEAELHAAIRVAFPLLPRAAIRHQTQFSFKFGHAEISLNGLRPRYSARARADVILYFEDKPLAVLELKRKDIPLEAADGLQGLSYAKLLNPMPPLVVVSNGVETRYLETHGAKVWSPVNRDELAFKALMDNAAEVATGDLKLAVQNLMGTNPEVWMQAIRQATSANLDELTGDLADIGQPFARDFLIPRKATFEVIQLLPQRRLILVEGSSLVGKSNVLRELCEMNAKDKTRATLYLETSSGASIIQSVADVLEDHLDWPVTPGDARLWLKKVSESDGPDLVLAIDGLNNDDRELRKEIEDLSSTEFGERLKLVVALDTSVASRIVITNGRSPSPIGRRAARVYVTRLNDKEFSEAARTFRENRLVFMRGAKLSREYRYPWVLRHVAADSLSSFAGQPTNTVLAPLPLLSIHLIEFARSRFDDIDLKRSFGKIAQAMLDEAKDRNRHPALVTECMATFAIRRTTLLSHLTTQELETLSESGYLKQGSHGASSADICYVRQPALLASELAKLLKSEILSKAINDHAGAAEWLTGTASRLPLGDVISAPALAEAATSENGLQAGILFELMQTKPTKTSLSPGAVLSAHLPEIGYVKFRVISDTQIEILSDGKPRRVSFDEPIGTPYADHTAWLILSHLCSAQTEIWDEHGNRTRLESAILLQVSSSEMPLLPSFNTGRQLLTHELPDGSSIVCHRVGIVEPITQSILIFLQRDLEESLEWIKWALTTKSAAVVARIHIALSEIANMTEPFSGWAKSLLANHIIPEMKAFFPGNDGHFAE